MNENLSISPTDVDHVLYRKIIREFTLLDTRLRLSPSKTFYYHTISSMDAYHCLLCYDLDFKIDPKDYKLKKVLVAQAGRKPKVALNPIEQFAVDYNEILWTMHTEQAITHTNKLRAWLNKIYKQITILRDYDPEAGNVITEEYDTHNSQLNTQNLTELVQFINLKVTDPYLHAPLVYRRTIEMFDEYTEKGLLARTVLTLYLCHAEILYQPVFPIHQSADDLEKTRSEAKFVIAFLELMVQAAFHANFMIKELLLSMDETKGVAREAMRWYLDEMHDMIYSKVYCDVTELKDKTNKKSRLSIHKYLNELEDQAILDPFFFNHKVVYRNPGLDKILQRQDWKSLMK